MTHIFEKQVGIVRAEEERARTLAAREVAQETDLFYVPALHQGSDDTVVLEFLSGLVRLSELLEARDVRLPELVHRTGRAIAAVHRDARLPSDAFKPDTESIVSDDASTFIHGDLTMDNVCFQPETDRLVIVDWSLAPVLREGKTVDSAYLDIVWFLSHVCRTPSAKRLNIPKKDLLDSFLQGYGDDRPGFLNADEFRRMQRGLDDQYRSQITQAALLRKGIRRIGFLGVQRIRHGWWLRYSPAFVIANQTASAGK